MVCEHLLGRALLLVQRLKHLGRGSCRALLGEQVTHHVADEAVGAVVLRASPVPAVWKGSESGQVADMLGTVYFDWEYKSILGNAHAVQTQAAGICTSTVTPTHPHTHRQSRLRC